MKKEIDPTAQLLVEMAASDAYTDLVTTSDVSAVTKFIHAGDDIFRVRVSLVQDGEEAD